MKVQLFLPLFLFFVTELVAQKEAYISRVEVNGLNKSKETLITGFIDCKSGQPFDTTAIKRDIQKLKNLQIFENIDYTYQVSKVHADSIALTFLFNEKITLIPYLDFGGIKDNFWFQVGLIDYNFIGKLANAGFSYRYNQRHSFQGYVKFPYINGSRWGTEIALTHLSTIEPIYLNSKLSQYKFDNSTIEVLGRREFRFGHFIRFGGAYFQEKYVSSDTSDALPGIPDNIYKHKYLVKAIHDLHALDYNFEYVNGLSNTLLLESIKTKGHGPIFWKMTNVFKLYKKLFGHGNFAQRIRLGLSANSDSPFAPFVLDSYVNIRGSGNRVARGTAEFTLNTEYRHSVLKHPKHALQAVTFLDWGGWRSPGGSFNELYDQKNQSLFTGGGIRWHFFQVYNLIFRIDYAIDVNDSKNHGPVLGIGQYF